MRRPKKPQPPEKPKAPSKTIELWDLLWGLNWPDDFGENGLPWEGEMTVEAFRAKLPKDLQLTSETADDLRIRWRGTINWDAGDLAICLEQRRVVPNSEYQTQVRRYEDQMTEYATLYQEYEEKLKAWELLDQACTNYEKSVASKSKK